MKTRIINASSARLVGKMKAVRSAELEIKKLLDDLINDQHMRITGIALDIRGHTFDAGGQECDVKIKYGD